MELLKKFQDEVVISTFPEIAEPDSTVRIEADGKHVKTHTYAQCITERFSKDGSRWPSTQGPSPSAPPDRSTQGYTPKPITEGFIPVTFIPSTLKLECTKIIKRPRPYNRDIAFESSDTETPASSSDLSSFSNIS
eukprot:GHVP01028847.1.p1 GENE.GHVP01028847.1~~GHVP01028847.1.p1  ORF type:complete len:135 (-),score=16.15 GHVP01028847.1:67-471(-)